MVEWDWPEQTDVWQPYFNMKNKTMIEEFHRRHPNAPGPHPKFDDYDNETAAAVLWVAGISPHFADTPSDRAAVDGVSFGNDGNPYALLAHRDNG